MQSDFRDNCEMLMGGIIFNTFVTCMPSQLSPVLPSPRGPAASEWLSAGVLSNYYSTIGAAFDFQFGLSLDFSSMIIWIQNGFVLIKKYYHFYVLSLIFNL